jgi:hypothetical protein
MQTRLVLPSDVAATVDRYLTAVDRLLPGRIAGFYVVGSTALGAWRPLRSDIDFIATVDGGLTAGELRRLRVAQLLSGLQTGAAAIRRAQRALPGTCNGVFVRCDQLDLPVRSISPVASHAGLDFVVGGAFDVNPVVWKTFAENGITVRGRAPHELALDPEPDELVPWTVANLNSYWRGWAEAAVRHRPPMSPLLPARWRTAWGVLGTSRMHATVTTGDVISKEAAAHYALDRFDHRWHPLISEALDYWQRRPSANVFSSARDRFRSTGTFMIEVIDDAAAIARRT